MVVRESNGRNSQKVLCISYPKAFGLFCLAMIMGMITSNWTTSSSELNEVMEEMMDFMKAKSEADPLDKESEWASLSSSSSSSLFCKDTSPFDQIVDNAYMHMLDKLPILPRREFNWKFWKRQGKNTGGGLAVLDRNLLATIYRQANSVFEYGLGESTLIANHVGVRRYVGIDSDPNFVAMTRSKVSNSYRFYMADIGPTKLWGHPVHRMPKQTFSYQLAPLVAEPLPFDVYMVDGRFRFPCVLASFLHASARGAQWNETTVLLHDCGQTRKNQPERRKRGNYHVGDQLLDLVDHSGKLLCVFKRKPETTDEQLMELWMKTKLDIN